MVAHWHHLFLPITDDYHRRIAVRENAAVPGLWLGAVQISQSALGIEGLVRADALILCGPLGGLRTGQHALCICHPLLLLEQLLLQQRRLREHFGVVVERTVLELNGVACLELDDVQPKKEIVASRAFGAPVYTRDELAETIREYMARAVRKLRNQQSTAAVVGGWVETNAFRPQDPQYRPSVTMQLPAPSDDIAVLTQAAQTVLRCIFKSGFRYVKSGVMLLDLSDRGVQQGSLFDTVLPATNAKRDRLLDTLDKVDAKWGRGTVGIGSAGMPDRRAWAMQRGNLSPAYTTRWDELPVAIA